jgi:hypothetical protein
MSARKKPLLAGKRDSQAQTNARHRRFLTAWSLLLGLLWLWSFVTWSEFGNANEIAPYPDRAMAMRPERPAPPEPFALPEPTAKLLTLMQDPGELNCLALTLYFEARGEPVEGQMAVAHVILARVASQHYPDTICGVVKQARKPGPFQCQFTAWCDNKSETPRDLRAYRKILGLSVLAMLIGPVPDAPTHYHADYVQPNWPNLAEVSRVGGHVFYR